MHVRDFRLLLELCRAASLPTRLAALVCIPLSWCIGVGYTCILPAGGCSVVSHSECDLQPLVIGVLRLGFSRQLQGLIGRLCLTFTLGLVVNAV